jgi:hypothetical protein
MSNQGKAPICRQTYFNYGSYLRARDNEKQLCTVITEIENGTIVPYIVSNGGYINGNLTVKGNLTVTGNFVVNGSITYAGDIVLGSTCSDTIAIKGTSTFECPATFMELSIMQSGPAVTQPVFKVESNGSATAANLPSVTVSAGPAPDLLGKSSNVCGIINHVGLPAGATLTLTFATSAALERPSVQITVQGDAVLANESIHLTGSSATGFVITNTSGAPHTGVIHYFVVDIGV